MIRLGLVALLVGLAVVWPPLQAQDSIVNSPHDLSMFGRANIRAVNEDEICIFCHAPHNSDPAIPAWNRHMPQTWYRIYQSSTLQARLDQPGPESKMCLSCHDGSIAMGLVLSRPPTDPIVMNQPFMPTGLSNLTNDLSDDHPIGFRYDQQLSNRDSQLRPPQLVSQAIKLGPRGELECVACHDPHNNEFGNFLRITDRQGALCTTCHQMNGWRTSAHTLSPRTVPATVTNGVPLEFRSMNDAACSACHVSHFAPYNDRLLRDRPYDLCIGCHNGITATNIESATGLRSGHQTGR
ncbi:MAG: hypothetical protein J5I93_11025, partial [Pirellulaceae bacterium]|nr:hypothetical protein [Pirellulaceae bacterium]